MQAITLHTRLREGREEYDRIHARIPAALAEALHSAGAIDWRIWRSGRDLFHLVECQDLAALMARMAEDPANREWQRIVGPLLEERPSGAGDALPLVWRLADEDRAQR